jgi:hypothetical protein
VNSFLREISGLNRETTAVKLKVSADTEKRVYMIEFHGKKYSEKLIISDTEELVRTLRHPIRIGGGFETKSGRLLTWNHLIDVEYIEDNDLSLSFLNPLVHRSRFFPDEYPYPKTCAEFLDTDLGDEVRIEVAPENGNLRSLKLKMDGLPNWSLLRKLEDVSFNIFELGILTECSQLIDISTRLRHPVNLDASGIVTVKSSKINDYPRLRAALDSVDLSEFDWSTDSWTLGVNLRLMNHLRWSIVSSRTGEAWMNKTFDFRLDPTLSLDEVLDTFKDEVSGTIPLDNLNNVDEKLENLKTLLKGRGWSVEAPKCRIDIEQSNGRYEIVVSQILEEALREIDRISLIIPEENGEIEKFYEALYEGVLVTYNIINESEFLEAVKRFIAGELIDKDAIDIDEIREWEDRLLKQVAKHGGNEKEKHKHGNALANLAEFLHSVGRSKEGLEYIKQALEVFNESDVSKEVKTSHINALLLACEMMLVVGGDNVPDMVDQWLNVVRDKIRTPIDDLDSPVEYRSQMSLLRELEDRLRAE